jgi:hypothetical protein
LLIRYKEISAKENVKPLGSKKKYDFYFVISWDSLFKT